ncbi:carbohydrate ABC transporter permease [Vallitalea pronyensis]|uniref:Carbohydrate ABC transporter permease n=1 Tax=Vallitalea pronyensis TaxID=1348613 RepID=A0A8J8MMM1_9FIRM|nr:carbohydrate ABC transporter permease [Vallitalea pronyensis]QUI24465.1 carbohydrate ABC transporter permease [Vallitalea pronyensis]
MNYKERGSDKVFTMANNILLGILFLIVAYPLLYVISASLSDSNAIIQGRVKLFPVGFNLDGYKAVFSHGSIMTGFFNSFFYMTVGTLVNIILTIMIAYPLSRQKLIGKKVISLMLVFTIMFNAGLIPNYLLIDTLDLIDKRAVMIIPKALNVFNVMITITYFKTTIPKELLESARIDGCDDINFICKIVLPLSRPIIAVITLFYAVEHWNSFFDALIYLNSKSLLPLQIILRDILVQNLISLDMVSSIDPDTLQSSEKLAVLLKYSLIVVASAPLMVLYPFIQRHFVKGVMVGSVKG